MDLNILFVYIMAVQEQLNFEGILSLEMNIII